jgi:sulfide:quinone oxidoreductase
MSERFSVIVAGGGVAALEGILALRALAAERIEVELLAPERRFDYRPLAVAEPFGAGAAEHFELSELASEAGARLRVGALAEVDADARVARTGDGAELAYDALLVACGAVAQPALPGAFTFGGAEDVPGLRAIMAEAVAGKARRIVFAIPGGQSWPLPLYELALQAATYLARRGARDVRIEIVSHETAPLRIFGFEASSAIARLLSLRGIRFRGQKYPISVEGGQLEVKPDGPIPADRVVSLPQLVGPQIVGLPRTAGGFIPTDPHGRVHGLSRVFAAGDATAFPIKQGGIAAQQAEAAAESIAALAGAQLAPQPFRPVLRGLVLTGGAPRYLRTELVHAERTSTSASEPLWWPPGKIVGRYLAPFLASLKSTAFLGEPPAGPDVIPVEVEVTGEGLDPLAGPAPTEIAC